MPEKKYEICLRLSDEEREQLDSKAKECGMSRTALLRRMITGQKIRARPSEELRKLRLEIHYIGVNINQIARSVNAGIARPSDAKHGLYTRSRSSTQRTSGSARAENERPSIEERLAGFRAQLSEKRTGVPTVDRGKKRTKVK